MWPCILPDRDGSWSYSLRTRSIQCHSNPVLSHPNKSTDPMMDLHHGQPHDLETRVDFWTIMHVVLVDYRTFSHTFCLTMWLFQFITKITLRWYFVLWWIIALLVCIDLWINLSI